MIRLSQNERTGLVIRSASLIHETFEESFSKIGNPDRFKSGNIYSALRKPIPADQSYGCFVCGYYYGLLIQKNLRSLFGFFLGGAR